MPFILLTLLLAFVLNAVPLPDVLVELRPAWVLMVALYWTIHLTHRVGLVWCWLLGLLLDVLTAAPLGLNALCFVLVGGLAWRFSVQIRVFGLRQQGLVIVALVFVTCCVGYLLRWLTGLPPSGVGWLLPVVGSALVWLPLAVALRWLHMIIAPH